eukprot:m.10422 g.10422  ORF g.10422 m.10422 type:complete len:476 (+) comp4257_c0_seq1:46-1473(+)
MFWTLLSCAVIFYILVQIKAWVTRPKNAPPVYSEFPTIPWLGSIWQFATGPREFIQRAHASLGDTFTVNLFGKSLTFLMNSEGHRKFFMGKEDVFDIRKAYRCTVVTFGPGVCYDCPVKKMGEQLGFLKTGLTQQRYISYVPILHKEAEDYFQKEWGDVGEKCLFTALSELFTLTSARCLLGPELRAQWSGEFSKMYWYLDHSFIPITFFLPWLPNPMRGKCIEARSMFQKMFKEVVKKRRENGEVFDDFLQVLMDTKYKNGDPLSIEEVTGIMIGTLLGGQHTSNTTGTWALCHLLLDQTWRDNLLQEQRKLLGGDLSKDLTYTDLENMKVFDMVLNETLRLHPPFFQLARILNEDVEFQGYTLPKDHIVSVSPGAVQRIPSMWGPDGEEYNPGRWTEENASTHKDYSWIPFGGGRHACSGRKFATISLKVVLSWLVRNYELELVSNKLPKEDYTTMVVAPVGPVLIRYKKRKH